MMLAIYSAGWEVEAPLFFALPPLPRVMLICKSRLWLPREGEILIIYLCWQRQIAEAITVLSRVYSTVYLLTKILEVMYCIRAMFIFECAMD
jgi:hypothetical protein